MVVVPIANVLPAVLKVNCEFPAIPSPKDNCGTVDEAMVRGKMREVVVPIEITCWVG